MTTVYDSGWIHTTSGTISAGVDTSDLTMVRVIFAASGSNGGAISQLGWTAGAPSPIPWKKYPSGVLPPPVSPIVSGSYSTAAPAANATSSYRIGIGQSGTIGYLDSYVPEILNVAISASASSWIRAIVEGH